MDTTTAAQLALGAAAALLLADPRRRDPVVGSGRGVAALDVSAAVTSSRGRPVVLGSGRRAAGLLGYRAVNTLDAMVGLAGGSSAGALHAWRRDGAARAARNGSPA